jgi:hypothetical protein
MAKVVPEVITCCLKAAESLTTHVGELEASLGDALSRVNPGVSECEKDTPEPRCGYEERLRQLLAELQNTDERVKDITARLEV